MAPLFWLKNCGPFKMTDFLLCPGDVVSKSDGQTHFISAMQLVKLYGVQPYECTYDSPYNRREGLLHLEPNYDGDYSLPDVVFDPCEHLHIDDSICQMAFVKTFNFLIF